jgi:phosphopantetheinyl transferase
MSAFDPIFNLIRPNTGEAKVLVVELASPIGDRLIGLLSKHERHQCHRFRHEEDRRASGVMRGLWKLGAGALTDCHPSEIEMLRNSLGRPVIQGLERDQRDLNVSRTKSCCGLIMSGDGRCGIDIERVEPGLVTPELIEMLFGVNQNTQKMSQDVGGFFTRWVQTEAALKADGRGLSDGLRIAQRVICKSDGRHSLDIGPKTWTIGATRMPLGIVGSYALEHERTRVSQICIKEIEAVWTSRILCAH